MLNKLLFYLLDEMFYDFLFYRKLRKGTWYKVLRDKYGNGNSSGITYGWQKEKPIEDDTIGTYCKIVQVEEHG